MDPKPPADGSLADKGSQIRQQFDALLSPSSQLILSDSDILKTKLFRASQRFNAWADKVGPYLDQRPDTLKVSHGNAHNLVWLMGQLLEKCEYLHSYPPQS